MPVFWKAMVKDKKIKMNMKIHRFNLRSPANRSSIVQILLWPLKSSAISCASALTASWHSGSGSGSGSDFEFINSKSQIYYNELMEYEAKPFSEPELTCSFSFGCLAILWLCVWMCSMQIIDEEETQFMTNCPHAVMESTPRRRTNIQVYWTAPPSGSGCVLLKYVYSR